MLYLFQLVKWVVNIEKSILTPTQNVTFLGATWLKERVVRHEYREYSMSIGLFIKYKKLWVSPHSRWMTIAHVRWVKYFSQIIFWNKFNLLFFFIFHYVSTTIHLKIGERYDIRASSLKNFWSARSNTHARISTCTTYRNWISGEVLIKSIVNLLRWCSTVKHWIICF